MGRSDVTPGSCEQSARQGSGNGVHALSNLNSKSAAPTSVGPSFGALARAALSVLSVSCRDPATIRVRVRNPDEVVLVGESQLSEHDQFAVMSRPDRGYEIVAARTERNITVRHDLGGVPGRDVRVFGSDDGFTVETDDVVILRRRPQQGEQFQRWEESVSLSNCVLFNWPAARGSCVAPLLIWRSVDTAALAFRISPQWLNPYYAWTSRANVVSISRYEPVDRSWGWIFLGIGLAAGAGFEAVARIDDRHDFNISDVMAIVWAAPLIALGIVQLTIPTRTHELYP